MEKEFKITFLPEGRSIYAIKGTSLFEAAGRAGILITSPCGGAGKCGKCRVRIIRGGLNEITASEESVLGKADIEKGFRLSCQAHITESCTLEIPDSSRVGTCNILVSGRLQKIKIEPGVRKEPLILEKPDLGENISYSDIIRNKTGCQRTNISALRDISGLINENSEGFSAVILDGEAKVIEPKSAAEQCCGLALDLGTTTLAGTVLNLSSGEELAVSSRLNPQSAYGDDLITRINFACKSRANFEKISGAIIRCVNDMTEELSEKAGILPRHIYKMTVAGNTVMQHIFCGVNPSSLSKIPFIPVFRQTLEMNAGEAGINICPSGKILVFPSAGGFVGGDAVSAIIASGMARSGKTRILIDIGTNGEIIIGNRKKLLCASTAAGPAFESGKIKMGMIASRGAIEKVVINDDVHINVIGNARPVGICGSGLIDAAAQMLNAGIVDSSGRMLPPGKTAEKMPRGLAGRIVQQDGMSAFVLGGGNGEPPVSLTQRDIRELQLAKSAISSGIKILKQKLKVRLDDIEEVLIAGAFGNFIRRSNARRIGLIPDIPSSKIKFIGNASSSGAKLLLLSTRIEKEAAGIANSIEHVELATSGSFQKEFAESMLFPE